MSTYKVNVISGVKEFKSYDLELKQPVGKEVLVKVSTCAICTLEQRIFGGMMKRYPFAGGHEVAGIVEAVGPEVSNVVLGDKVAIRLLTSCGECYYCRSGHENQCVISFKAAIHEGLNGPGGLAEYMTVHAKNIYKMSPEVDLNHAALTEPLACCIHSIKKGEINLGDDVVVIGAGIMGAFHIQLAKLRGARVIVCEVDDNRLDNAKKIGADIVINSKKENAVERVMELTEGRGAHAVFCTVPFTKVAEDSIAMTGKLGRTIMYSSFHPDLPIDLSVNKVHYSEMVITGSVNPKNEDFLAATRLISNKIIDVSPLISEIIHSENIELAFERAIDPSTYRVIVKY